MTPAAGRQPLQFTLLWKPSLITVASIFSLFTSIGVNRREGTSFKPLFSVVSAFGCLSLPSSTAISAALVAGGYRFIDGHRLGTGNNALHARQVSILTGDRHFAGQPRAVKAGWRRRRWRHWRRPRHRSCYYSPLARFPLFSARSPVASRQPTDRRQS